MAFQDLVTAAQKYFPDLQVQYKDQSTFMKILGMILFFNKSFMTDYTTTIGSTVYFPTASFPQNNSTSASIVLMHELVHISDEKKWGRLIFSFLYLTPQILVLLCLPLLFINWYIALPLLLLFASPLPSWFRMYFEKRAYMASLYVLNALSKKQGFPALLASQEGIWLEQFQGSGYYYMWPFSNLKTEFDAAVAKIQAGQRPYEDPIFDTLDILVNSV